MKTVLRCLAGFTLLTLIFLSSPVFAGKAVIQGMVPVTDEQQVALAIDRNCLNRFQERQEQRLQNNRFSFEVAPVQAPLSAMASGMTGTEKTRERMARKEKNFFRGEGFLLLLNKGLKKIPPTLSQ